MSLWQTNNQNAFMKRRLSAATWTGEELKVKLSPRCSAGALIHQLTSRSLPYTEQTPSPSALQLWCILWGVGVEVVVGGGSLTKVHSDLMSGCLLHNKLPLRPRNSWWPLFVGNGDTLEVGILVHSRTQEVLRVYLLTDLEVSTCLVQISLFFLFLQEHKAALKNWSVFVGSLIRMMVELVFICSLVAGCSIGLQPLLLYVSKWDMGQAKNIKYIFPNMFSVIFNVSVSTGYLSAAVQQWIMGCLSDMGPGVYCGR